jgi:membrane-associated PAP2 superfamily phosphatase
LVFLRIHSFFYFSATGHTFGSILLKKRLIELACVLFFLIVSSTVLWLMDADRLIIEQVPRNLEIAEVLPASSWAWPAGNVFPWNLLYTWAAVPAFLLAFAALVVFSISFLRANFLVWRKKALFVLLFLIIGPGLLVNLILKEQVGRARPREIVEFGGPYQFTQFWQPGTAGTNSSFPSGHAAIAFALMAPWFPLRGHQRRLALGFLLGGVFFGLLVGIARILQGGHFASDVLWAGGLLYLMGGLLALFMDLDEARRSTESP